MFRSRNDPVRLFGRRLLLLGLSIVIIFAAVAVWGAYQKSRESAVLRADAERQFAELSGREKQLTGDIARLQTDRGMEEALREQYALAAHGEKLIVIVDQHAEPPATTTPTFMEKLKKAFIWW